MVTSARWRRIAIVYGLFLAIFVAVANGCRNEAPGKTKNRNEWRGFFGDKPIRFSFPDDRR